MKSAKQELFPILHVGKLRLRVLIFWPKSLKNEVAELRHESPILTPNLVWLGDSGGLQAGGVKVILKGGQGAGVQIHAQPS